MDENEKEEPEGEGEKPEEEHFGPQDFSGSDGDPTPDEVFEAVHGYKPSTSPEEMAKRQFLEALPGAVQQLINLSITGGAEKIRLDASRYIVERNLGRIAERLPIGDMWEQLLKELQTDAEKPK